MSSVSCAAPSKPFWARRAKNPFKSRSFFLGVLNQKKAGRPKRYKAEIFGSSDHIITAMRTKDPNYDQMMVLTYQNRRRLNHMINLKVSREEP